MNTAKTLFLQVNLSQKLILTKSLHISPALLKIQAGRYKVTRDRSRPLTYEQAFWPEQIANKKGWNTFNTAQLEGALLGKEEMGQDLPSKMIIEDRFIRKFMNGTWPESFASEIMIKRQHNLIRIAGIFRMMKTAKLYSF
jgi:small subunit ribosomal protein S24